MGRAWQALCPLKAQGVQFLRPPQNTVARVCVHSQWLQLNALWGGGGSTAELYHPLNCWCEQALSLLLHMLILTTLNTTLTSQGFTFENYMKKTIFMTKDKSVPACENYSTQKVLQSDTDWLLDHRGSTCSEI